MSKTTAYCTLIVLAGVVIMLSAHSPIVLSDKNKFLFEFVNHELLNVLGVILAITLASAGQLHLTLNEIENRYRQPDAFFRTRAGIRSASYWLIGLFLSAVLLVTAKPHLSEELWAQSLFNGASLIILIWDVLILISIIQAVFSIRPQ